MQGNYLGEYHEYAREGLARELHSTKYEDMGHMPFEGPYLRGPWLVCPVYQKCLYLEPPYLAIEWGTASASPPPKPKISCIQGVTAPQCQPRSPHPWRQTWMERRSSSGPGPVHRTCLSTHMGVSPEWMGQTGIHTKIC